MESSRPGEHPASRAAAMFSDFVFSGPAEALCGAQ